MDAIDFRATNDGEDRYQGEHGGSHSLKNVVHLGTWAFRTKLREAPEVGGLVGSVLDQRRWRFAMLAVVECKILVQKNLAHDPFKESDFVDILEMKGKETYSRAGGTRRERRVFWPLAWLREPGRDSSFEVGNDIHRRVPPQGRMS